MPAIWYRHDPARNTLTLTLHIQPGAKRTEVAAPHGDALKIKLAAPPLEGRANAALVEFLAQRFGVPRSQVLLKSGERSRRKVVEISGSARGPEELISGTPVNRV